ncbi:MAG TPA: peptidoglycan-binding protein [Azospirillaceae bacterium]|nr:peptidoglycan-binding protein [Azospirillaceae bacterium]
MHRENPPYQRSASTTTSRRRSNLGDRVGDGLPNNPQDIIWLKRALSRLGRYNDRGDPHPFIDRALANAITGYQRDRGLRRDGLLNPGGETECAICVELKRLLEGAGR